jgi:transcriptional regulator with XRE-family HTH domain
VSFANEMKRLRLLAGMSRDELAALCGLSAGAVGAYERGAAVPTLTSAKRLAAALGVTIDALAAPEPPRDGRRRKFRRTAIGEVV